jgi:hypothetical protein
MKDTRAGLIPIMMAAFTAAGMLFATRLGIEADEALVGNGIYEHGAPLYSWKWGSAEIPIMLLSYLGALKTWFYSVWFLAWRPGRISLRLPMLLIAAATLWQFFLLLDRTVSRRAAWIGTVLLASDSSYLLMNTADYGPVTLQFFLKSSAILLVVKFHRTGSRWALAAGFFLIGLALWDKAVFLWILFGLGVAVMAVFPREVRRALTLRNLGAAAAGVLVGALPLVIYNIARPLDTLRSNAALDARFIPAKAGLLTRTIDGQVLFGFITADNPGSRRSYPRRNLTLAALLLTLAALPFLWRTVARAPMLFGLITCAATFLPMALTANAGWAAQHTILLWPFHFLAIAAAVSRAPARWASAICAVLCLSNIAVTSQYYADLIRNGPAIRWTDAIDPLSKYLSDSRVPLIFGVDWGFVETLNLISEGELPVSSVDMPDAATIRRMIAIPGGLFVSHTPEFAYHPEIRAAVEDTALQDGYEEERLATIPDRNGKPTFEVFRFRKH